jgi:hypothetical protein
MAPAFKADCSLLLSFHFHCEFFPEFTVNSYGTGFVREVAFYHFSPRWSQGVPLLIQAEVDSSMSGGYMGTVTASNKGYRRLRTTNIQRKVQREAVAQSFSRLGRGR